jgi:hypothetical protein
MGIKGFLLLLLLLWQLCFFGYFDYYGKILENSRIVGKGCNNSDFKDCLQQSKANLLRKVLILFFFIETRKN